MHTEYHSKRILSILNSVLDLAENLWPRFDLKLKKYLPQTLIQSESLKRFPLLKKLTTTKKKLNIPRGARILCNLSNSCECSFHERITGKIEGIKSGKQLNHLNNGDYY